MRQRKKAVLVVIDGWGIRSEKEWNAIAAARTPHYSKYIRDYPMSRLEASGMAVGLLEGVMGNSEVGHMNIGAGQRVVQDQVRIYEAIDSGKFFRNATLTKHIHDTRQSGRALHLLGLVSQGSVHSAEKHYLSLIEMIHSLKFPMEKLFIHSFLDGRDTPPKSAEIYLRTLEAKLNERGGQIATVIGRFYAMDRDKRWERIDEAYRAMVLGEGEKASSSSDALEKAYRRGETDEFVKPTVLTSSIGLPKATIRNQDGVICFNFRPDRMRELVRALTNNDAPIPSIRPDIRPSIVTFTQYDKTFTCPVAFAPHDVKHCMGEVISAENLSQFRTAETEKYAHVTYFFNGGREAPFPREERLMIPSPQVKTYDLTPEMSSRAVTDSVTSRVQKDQDTLIVVNFAHPDMVGHTGNFEAAVLAVESTDHCLGRIVESSFEKEFQVFITADHGNVELMKDPITGQPHTAHTLNPVPFIAIAPEWVGRAMKETGSLCDVAPTILHCLEIPPPPEMTGKNLLTK